MPAPASTRFTVSHKANQRIVLSVREQNNGRLIITVQSTGNKFRDLGVPAQNEGITPRHNVRIAHQKFSIHPSAKSTEHNQLHFHQVFDDGVKEDRYHVTKAIKSGRFAPLFVRRYSSLRDTCYDLRRGGNIANVGEFDPDRFSMVLCVLVGQSDCMFRGRTYDISTFQRAFREFRIVILGSFFLLPATDFSMISGFMTLRPEDATSEEDRKFRERVMEGWDAQEAILAFSELRNRIRDEGIETAIRFVPEMFRQTPGLIEMARCRYFKSGEFNNKVIKALRSKMPNGL
ncbi:hypothetical protein ACQR0Y_08045 [Bradyrhizobium oligotrophicum]|uniref:hypothetical protein n=1 Tax=Bradyrhizobium oligotrophicum TaxID=44255 RepID=UPI003EBFB243